MVRKRLGNIDYFKYTKIFLYLVALHSFVVALALMFSPSSLIEFFGYSAITEPFFKVQAGVFHLVMVTAYLIAAYNPVKNNVMLFYSVLIKFTATVFLVVYFLFVNHVVVILLSGVADFVMGVILIYLYKRLAIHKNIFE